MDWSLLIFLLLVLLFAYRGYKNGVYKSVSRVCSLLAGYAGAILFTDDLAPLARAELGLEGVAAFVIASLLLFIGASVTLSLLFWLAGKRLLRAEGPSTVSSAGGAVIGSLVGVLLAIVVVWSFAFLRDMRAADEIADASPSGVETLANRAASKAVDTALKMSSAQPEIVGLGAALMASPAEVAGQARRLAASREMRDLLNDPANQRVLDSGDYAALRELPAFRRLMDHPDLQALARSAGLGAAPGDDDEASTAVAVQLSDLWRRAQRVKNDSRVQAIVDDPDFRQKLESGNPLALIVDPRIIELAEIIFAAEAAAAAPPAEGKSEAPRSETKIFSWTDSSGRVHYSDEPPPE